MRRLGAADGPDQQADLQGDGALNGQAVSRPEWRISAKADAPINDAECLKLVESCRCCGARNSGGYLHLANRMLPVGIGPNSDLRYASVSDRKY